MNTELIINAPVEIINAMHNAPDLPASFYQQAYAALETMRQERLAEGVSVEAAEKELMTLALDTFYKEVKASGASEIQAHGMALRLYLRVMGINPDECSGLQIH